MKALRLYLIGFSVAASLAVLAAQQPVNVVNTPSVTVSGTTTVSGTVTANQGGTWTVQPGNTANTTAWKVDGSAVTQPVSGTVTANAGTGTFTVSGTVTANAGTNLNTSALALDTSVNGLLLSQGSTTSGQKGPLAQGAVTTSAPSYTTAQTSPLSLNTAGGLRVDGSGVTQPVSGTVTANAGTGTFNIQSNASVNVAQVNGSTVTTAATGTQKVGIVGNAGGAVDAATGAAPPANVIYVGGLQSGATAGLLGGLTVCDQTKPISVTANTQLVTGVSGRLVYICHLELTVAAATNVAIVEGTGSTCATSTAGVIGGATAATGHQFAANGGISSGSGLGWIAKTATTGDNVCIFVSAANQTSGVLTFAIY